MREDLDQALVKDFPNLYRDRNGNMRTTAMCWGFPNDGWEPLLREASAKIEALILAYPEDQRPNFRALQVKEKFGTLRFYIRGDSQMQAIANEAERKSSSVCEECGAPGVLREGSWIRTTCDEHCEGAPAFDRAKWWG